MAFVLSVFETGDYERWKELFDSDPGDRKGSGKGHRLFRSVDNPNEVLVGTEFDSVDDANAFRDRLLASGALDNITVVKEPTVAELVEENRY